MNMKKKNLLSFLCLLLVLALNLSFTAYITAIEIFSYEENITSEEVNSVLKGVPEILDDGFIKEYSLIDRNQGEEMDLNTVVFKNTAGNNVMFTYAFPVKYVGDDGKIYDKTNKITLLENNEKYQYTNKNNDIKTLFSKRIGDGITLTDGKYSITTVPCEAKKNNSAPNKTTYYEQDAIVYEDVFGDKSQLVYILTYNGYKEEIVLSEYYGVNSFSFMVYTNGLDIKEIWTGELYLVDKDESFVANIGGQYVITADEANNTFADLSVEVIDKYEKYIVTLELSEEYLTSDKTKYPIRIDPSVSFSGSNAVEDVTICSSSASVPNSNSLYVGKGSTSGTMRTLMKFPTFSSLNINPVQIISAEVSIRDLMCESYSMDVFCHDFNSEWNVSTVQWSDCATFNYENARMSKKRTVSYSKGQGLSTAHRYTYDITALAKEWLNESSSLNKGIIFKASEDFEENGQAGKYRTFCSSNRANYSNYYPRLIVEYTDELPEGIYTIMDSSSGKMLITERNENEESILTSTSFQNEDAKNGDHLWHIGKNYDGSYTLTSVGQKPLNYDGLKEYVLYNSESTASLSVADTTASKWSAEIVDSTISGKLTVRFTNCSTGKKLYMNPVGTISCGTSATGFTLKYIEPYTFSDFWDGTYNIGIYDGVAHIKYVIDESIYTSNFFRDSSICDFSVVKDAWNGITEKIVIYCPDDSVPTGITPFIVTFKAEEMDGGLLNKYQYTFALTNPNGSNYNEVLKENWNNVVIILNDTSNSIRAFEDPTVPTQIQYRSPFGKYIGETF